MPYRIRPEEELYISQEHRLRLFEFFLGFTVLVTSGIIFIEYKNEILALVTDILGSL